MAPADRTAPGAGRWCVPGAGGASGPSLVQLALDPAVDDLDDVVELLGRQVFTGSNAVPLRQTGAAARRGRVLSDEDRMPAVRRLPAVVAGLRRRDALPDYVAGMLSQRRRCAALRGDPVRAAQREPRTERV